MLRWQYWLQPVRLAKLLWKPSIRKESNFQSFPAQKAFQLSDGQLMDVYKLFAQQIKKGLGKETHAKADTKCFITYVHKLPTGKEVGKSLALDLGGTNFRVLLLTLNGTKPSHQNQKTFEISQKIKTGPGEDLFSYIAECLDDFVKEMHLEEEKLPLGFTFSFPCVQLGLKEAKLLRWTKGFSCPGVLGQDIGRMLQDAINKRTGLNIDLTAVLNDTTGTLMSCAHDEQDCRIGVIVGTGTNACYYENVKCVEMLGEQHKQRNTNVIINIEWGAFGDGGCLDFIRTDFDLLVDKFSPNPGQQLFEKMCSGMYLGELMRLTLIDAIQRRLVLEKEPCRLDILDFLCNNRGCFETRVLSEIDTDRGINFEATRKALTALLNIEKISIEDCRAIKYMCECITKRSAYLVGTVLSVLINKISEPRITVGVDGAVYRYHPKYEKLMKEKMCMFVCPEYKFDTMLAEDGSGKGAALVAVLVDTDHECP